MFLNQTDVVVDKDLEKVIIAIDSSTEGTVSRASGETTETSSEIQLGWMHPAPNIEISWNYSVLNEIRWNLIKSIIRI